MSFQPAHHQPSKSTTRRPALYPRDPNLQIKSGPATPPIKHTTGPSDDIADLLEQTHIVGDKKATKARTATKSSTGKRGRYPCDVDDMDIDGPFPAEEGHALKRQAVIVPIGRLESIPLEVFDNIVSHLPPRDVLKLRLLNRGIEALVREAAFTRVTANVLTLDPADNHLMFALESTPEFFSTVKELTLNTDAQWNANLKTVFPTINDGWRCDILYHVAAMYNLKKLNFGTPPSSDSPFSSFQLHDSRHIKFVRECFEALFHDGPDAGGQQWYTRFLNLSKLSVVLPLDRTYKHPITLQHLLNRIEEFEFHVYPNSYCGWYFGGTTDMFRILRDGFLSYMTDMLKKLTISFPKRAPGRINIPVQACKNLTHLTILGLVLPENEPRCVFTDLCSLPALQHLTLDAYISVPYRGVRSDHNWKELYTRLQSLPKLLSFKNIALLSGGTGYAIRIDRLGFCDVSCWFNYNFHSVLDEQYSFLRGTPFWQDRAKSLREHLDADNKAFLDLYFSLEAKRKAAAASDLLRKPQFYLAA